MGANDRESVGRKCLVGSAILVTVGGVAALLAMRGGEPEARPPAPPQNAMATPFVWPGIQQPPVRRAADAGLRPGDEVIGVIAGGRPRAYATRAFAGMSRHVVNDVVGGVPVSVTVCDRNHCARVFTDAPRGKPLNLWLGGWDNGMLLRIPQGFYRQEDGIPTAPGAPPFPYEEMKFERTTWASWRAEYPETEVYVGPPEAEPVPELGPAPREAPAAA